jgi:hypothetical protein
MGNNLLQTSFAGDAAKVATLLAVQDLQSFLNYQNKDDFTALHAATANDDLDVTRLLIEAGCNVNVTSVLGRTPLMTVAPILLRYDCEKGNETETIFLHLPRNTLCNFLPCVPYQRGDCGVPHALSSVQCSKAVHIGDIYVTASFNQLVRDASMPFVGSDEEWRGPMFLLNIYVTTSFNQHLRDVRLIIVVCNK